MLESKAGKQGEAEAKAARASKEDEEGSCWARIQGHLGKSPTLDCFF
jgi:hypothetical protein